jgi:exodeoxyribonuclease VII large subunit
MAENESSPPTLASLRLGTKSRRKKALAPTLGLLFDDPPPTPTKSRAVPAPPAPAEPQIWSVQTLVGEIRQRVEGKYADLWVAGEISNLRPAPSGHVYFTLKDRDAQLPVVLFRRQAQLLRFRPKDGDEVHARGRVSIYESRGQLQLIAETLELRGAGALQLAFDRLKARLLAEGLFDASRKRPLPAFPKCIGLITSPSGAVLRDIIHVGRRRHAALNLLVYPAAMQGATCAGQVAAGIRWFNRHPDRADLILIARGGGSAEDLAGFNDEALARTIAASALPVVSAVGHETDFTIADFVSDLRAPTPSAAAEIVTAAQHRVEERLENLSRRARRAIRYHLLDLRQRYARLSAEQVLARLRDGVLRRDQRIDDLRFRLESAAQRRLRAPAARLAALSARLHRQDLRVRMARARQRLEAANASLQRASNTIIARRQTQLAHAEARLKTLSPLAVLDRGYALVYSAEGVLLRNANETRPGEQIRARLATGDLLATVTETTKS